MKRANKIVASIMAISLFLTSTITMTNVKADAEITRVSGANRGTTSMEVAREIFGTSDTVVLVNGYGYADGVSAAPLAKALNAPILLTSASDKPSSELMTTVASLGTKKIVIVGGEGVVTSALERALAKTYNIERIGGNSRYETNAAVAKRVLNITGKKFGILVSAEGYADALSVSSIAGAKGMPVLFGNSKEIPYEVKNATYGLEILAVGGNAVLPQSVLDTVGAKRIAQGASRFETNLEVLNYFKEGLNLGNIYAAAGGEKPTDFADALVASAAAAKVGAPVVLTGLGADESAINKANNYIENNITTNTKVAVVGGQASVSEYIFDKLKYIISKVNDTGNNGGQDGSDELIVVNSVEAATSKLDLAKSEKDLKLEFKVNGGKDVSLITLENSGYTIEFAVSKDVLKDDDGEKTGKIDKDKLKNNVGLGGDFEYQVIVYDLDGKETSRSETMTVEVIDNFTEAKSIDGVSITLPSGVEIKSGKLCVDEIAQITEVKYTTSKDVNQVIDKEEFIQRVVKFASSKPEIAFVDRLGKITAVQAGTTVITIEVRGLKKEVEVTVVEEVRVPKKSSSTVSSVKIGDGSKKSIEIAVVDQYGDPFKGVYFKDIEIKNDYDEIIAVAEIEGETNEEGKIIVTINSDNIKAMEVGLGNLYIKGQYINGDGIEKGTLLLGIVPVEVTALNIVSFRNLEKLDYSRDYELDKLDLKDNSLELAYNKYTSKGAYLGKEDSITRSEEEYAKANENLNDDIPNIKYLVQSSDENIIKVEVDNTGKIIVKAATGDKSKVGTAYIKILENGILRASQEIKVISSNSRIISAEFETTSITNVQTIDLDTEILKPEKIRIENMKGIARIGNDGTIYLDLDNDEKYDDGRDNPKDKDINLGKIKIPSYSIYDDDGNAVKLNIYEPKDGDTEEDKAKYGYINDGSGKIKANSSDGKFQAGTTGIIVVKIIDTEDTNNNGNKDDILATGTMIINVEK